MKRFYVVTLMAQSRKGDITYQSTHGWAGVDATTDDEKLYKSIIAAGCESFRRWGFVPDPADVSVLAYWVGPEVEG